MKKILFAAIGLIVVSHVFGVEPKSVSGVPFCFDQLRNTSRLGDSELRTFFEHMAEAKAAEFLDLNRDGIADFTGVEVFEFIERMKIILSDRRPFAYKRDAQGNPIENDDQIQARIRTNVI